MSVTQKILWEKGLTRTQLLASSRVVNPSGYKCSACHVEIGMADFSFSASGLAFHIQHNPDISKE